MFRVTSEYIRKGLRPCQNRPQRDYVAARTGPPVCIMTAMSDELNPNHPATREFRDQWHKLCAIMMMKAGVTIGAGE